MGSLRGADQITGIKVLSEHGVGCKHDEEDDDDDDDDDDNSNVIKLESCGM